MEDIIQKVLCIEKLYRTLYVSIYYYSIIILLLLWHFSDNLKNLWVFKLLAHRCEYYSYKRDIINEGAWMTIERKREKNRNNSRERHRIARGLDSKFSTRRTHGVYIYIYTVFSLLDCLSPWRYIKKEKYHKKFFFFFFLLFKDTKIRQLLQLLSNYVYDGYLYLSSSCPFYGSARYTIIMGVCNSLTTYILGALLLIVRLPFSYKQLSWECKGTVSYATILGIL